MQGVEVGMDTVSSGDTEKANLAGALALGLDYHKMGFPGGSDSKESACKAGDPGWIPWRREWQPCPLFLPGEFHGQRGLAGYHP